MPEFPMAPSEMWNVQFSLSTVPSRFCKVQFSFSSFRILKLILCVIVVLMPRERERDP